MGYNISLLNEYNKLTRPENKFRFCLRHPQLLKLFYSQHSVILSDYVIQLDWTPDDNVGVYLKHKCDEANIARRFIGYINYTIYDTIDIPLDEFIDKLTNNEYQIDKR